MIKKEYDIAIKIGREDTITAPAIVVQNDYDVYKLNIRVFDGNTEIDYSQIASATITFALSNGAVVQSAPDRLTLSASGISYDMGTDEISYPGQVFASVQLYGTDNERLTTARFKFTVQQDLITPGAVQSDSKFPLLQQLMTEVQQLKQDIVELQISDNSIMDTKLSDAAGQIKARLAELLDDFTSLSGQFDAHVADYASLFTGNADAKNSIYRGKYLGNTISAEQYTAISSGTFTDLYIGDYWTIEGVNWRIAAFNYYRNTGDTSVPGNHITIVPDTSLYTHVMNDTDITTGGYIGSKMYTEGLEQAKTKIRGIFGTHLVKHRQILSNATVDGKASGWAWLDSEVELMNEIMVYGASVFGVGGIVGGSGHNIGIGKSQLPLFSLNPRKINIGQSYWLRDVVSASYFAYVLSNGIARYNNASAVIGVRPAFSIS